jgi:hypothetical protein
MMWQELQKPGWPVTTIAPPLKKITITINSTILTDHFICFTTFIAQLNIALILFTFLVLNPKTTNQAALLQRLASHAFVANCLLECPQARL